MLELFNILFRLKEKSIQVIIIDPEDTSNPKEVFFERKYLKKSFVVLFSVLGVLAFLLFTLLLMRLSSGDASVRADLNLMVKRVNALSDSLLARDQQINQFQQLLRTKSPLKIESSSSDKSKITENNSINPQNRTSEIVFPEEWNKMGRMLGFRPGIRQSNKNTIENVFPAQFPVIGTITRPYLPDKGHIGFDIALREGTPIRSFADGVVLSADWTLTYGYVVSIVHDQSIIVIYKHLKNTRIQSGDRIIIGQEIGLVGNVGSLSTGSHLHVEVWIDGIHVDPMLYFMFDKPNR